MSKPEKTVRLGEPKELTPIWEALSRGDMRAAREEARKVAAGGASEPAKQAAARIVADTEVDRAHMYVAALVGCAWLLAVALAYFR